MQSRVYFGERERVVMFHFRIERGDFNTRLIRCEMRKRLAIDLDPKARAVRDTHDAFLVLDRLFQNRLPDRMFGPVEFEHRLER
jgi:hypothetical protein